MSDEQRGATTEGSAISEELLSILACPCSHHAPLRLEGERLICTDGTCSRVFRIEDGIPIMLLDEAEGDGPPA
ncbi:MAG TPA: Trm112 family protein [Thermomicrobiales bacterium]|jgi:hypothetical protein